MGRIEGKVAIVTGAASGIGAATAALFAAEGAAVVVADLDAEGAEARAESIRSAGHDASAVPFDLGDAASVEQLIEDSVSEYGGVDVLHNNAAATRLAATQDGPIADADPELWDQTFRVNVRGTMLAIKAVAPHILARGGGSIINTSSGAGHLGDLGASAYGASKAAINAVTKYAATQYGKAGIRVNAIAPGLIVTPASEESGHAGEMGEVMLANHLTPRLGTPEDVAYAALYLASDEAGFVTGQIFGVDGGIHAHAPYFSEMMAQFGS